MVTAKATLNQILQLVPNNQVSSGRYRFATMYDARVYGGIEGMRIPVKGILHLLSWPKFTDWCKENNFLNLLVKVERDTRKHMEISNRYDKDAEYKDQVIKNFNKFCNNEFNWDEDIILALMSAIWSVGILDEFSVIVEQNDLQTSPIRELIQNSLRGRQQDEAPLGLLYDAVIGLTSPIPNVYSVITALARDKRGPKNTIIELSNDSIPTMEAAAQLIKDDMKHLCTALSLGLYGDHAFAYMRDNRSAEHPIKKLPSKDVSKGKGWKKSNPLPIAITEERLFSTLASGGNLVDPEKQTFDEIALALTQPRFEVTEVEQLINWLPEQSLADFKKSQARQAQYNATMSFIKGLSPAERRKMVEEIKLLN